MGWNATNGRWDGNSSKLYPHIAGTSAGQQNLVDWGNVERILWVAPQAGKANVTGALGFSDHNATLFSTVEWAVGKRSGTTYTLLASGSITNSATDARTTVALDSATFPALLNVNLAAGDAIFLDPSPDCRDGGAGRYHV